jgi:serine/threonine protein kinase
MTLAAFAHLVEDLRRLELLDEPQQRELTDSLSKRFDDARGLARELIRREWLTPFQANQLLQNRSQELQFGPYLLLEKLGVGGMGQVFKARHRALGRLVALKVIRGDTLVNPIVVPRFEREVEAAARLQHPNVVRAYDAGKVDGTYYLAMELIAGVDLFQLIKQAGPLAVPQACDYLRQAALGLQHAHEHDLVHRDIKPANLFVARPSANSRGGSSLILPRPSPLPLSPAGRGVGVRGTSAMLARPVLDEYPWGVIKILDFGLARLQAPDDGAGPASITQLGAVMGTPDFIAPEQAWNSHTIDIRADLYSLGCTFYYMLSGRVPFPGGSFPEKLVRHCKTEADPVDRARREQLLGNGQAPHMDAAAVNAVQLPAAVVAVAQKLMAKQPEQRFQTPAELAEAMAELQRLEAKGATLTPPARARGKSTAVLRRPHIPRKRSTPARTPRPAPAIPVMAAPTTLPPSGQPRRYRRLRSALVFLGFLLCCGLCARLLNHDVPGAEGVPAPLVHVAKAKGAPTASTSQPPAVRRRDRSSSAQRRRPAAGWQTAVTRPGGRRGTNSSGRPPSTPQS